MKTLIIAEAGVNHNGDLGVAKELIKKAADAGADLIKFQSFSTEENITKKAPKAQYQIVNTGEDESQFEMVKKLELTVQDHFALLEECRNYGIGFFSTGFDKQSLDLLNQLGLDRFKIPSGEITNLPYLRHVGGFGKPIILSTGMANLGEIEAAVDVLEGAGVPRAKITVLHCNTEYPTPMGDVNLRAMRNIGSALGVAFGYSDHTIGIEVPIAAVALGATVIEKHLTLDKNLPGPDHRASIEPDELAVMVSAIRNIELAMGDGIKRPSLSEVGNKVIARKSLVARKPINAGDLFTPDNIAVKRPGHGISPMRWDDLIGQAAKRDYEPDELIEL